MRTILSMLCGIFLASTLVYAAPPTNGTTKPVIPSDNASATNSNNLSPSEWQELRTARLQALKANPGLVVKAAQLSERMRQFQQKLNSAMVKTDPNIAPVLAKFTANRPTMHPTTQALPKNQ